MQIQFHPASSRGAVRTVSVSPAGQRWMLFGAAVVAALTVSLWFTVPATARQAERRAKQEISASEARRADVAAAETAQFAVEVRSRARVAADLLNRAAFLYGIAPSAWPRVLAPESRFLADQSPEGTAAALPAVLRGLENGRVLLEAVEVREPGAAAELPSILPLRGADVETSAYFGPRRSPWTNAEEFLTGVEIAAPAGTAVVAPAGGSIVFAGTVRPRPAGTLWQLGNVVILSHGANGATVFGHLGRIDVKRGQRVERGTRIGLVGSSGWALSPELHYEYWRPEPSRPDGDSDEGSLRPTDPFFAVLDHALMRKPYSLEQMEATWAPGPLEPLPGIDISAIEAGAGRPVPPRRAHSRRL